VTGSGAICFENGGHLLTKAFFSIYCFHLTIFITGFRIVNEQQFDQTNKITVLT